MTLKEFLIEAVAKRNTGKYGFPHGELNITDLNKLLEELGYEEKPMVKGNLTMDYKRAEWLGQNCYFTYRDYYSIEVVVTSENNKENALAFHLAPYGFIDCVWVLGKNGKGIQGMGFDAKKNRAGFEKTVTEFLGIK